MVMYVDFPTGDGDVLTADTGAIVNESGTQLESEPHIGSRIDPALESGTSKHYPSFSTESLKMYPVFD